MCWSGSRAARVLSGKVKKKNHNQIAVDVLVGVLHVHRVDELVDVDPAAGHLRVVSVHPAAVQTQPYFWKVVLGDRLQLGLRDCVRDIVLLQVEGAVLFYFYLVRFIWFFAKALIVLSQIHPFKICKI